MHCRATRPIASFKEAAAIKLIALISFYDEDPEWLESCVLDLAQIGVSTIVACDGAYSRFPGGASRSPLACTTMLQDVTVACDVDLVLYQPATTWEDDEVEKRQFMIDLAWQVADQGDWFVIWDCDYKLVDMPRASLLPAMLQQTTLQVGEVSFSESLDPDNPGWHPMRMFLKAQPVVMFGNHHTYELYDGTLSQILSRPVPNMAEALDMSAIRILHRNHERTDERRSSQAQWYEQRDRLGLET